MTPPVDSEIRLYRIRLLLLGVVGVVCVLLLIQGLTHAPSTPAPSQAAAKVDPWHGQINYMDEPDKAGAAIDDWARRFHGDSTKLTTEQLRWLDSITAGHGARYLQLRAEELAKEQKKEKPHTQQKPAKSGAQPSQHERPNAFH